MEQNHKILEDLTETEKFNIFAREILKECYDEYRRVNNDHIHLHVPNKYLSYLNMLKHRDYFTSVLSIKPDGQRTKYQIILTSKVFNEVDKDFPSFKDDRSQYEDSINHLKSKVLFSFERIDEIVKLERQIEDIKADIEIVKIGVSEIISNLDDPDLKRKFLSFLESGNLRVAAIRLYGLISDPKAQNELSKIFPSLNEENNSLIGPGSPKIG